MENFQLNVALLRRRVPNLTSAAKSVGLRPATVSNLCNGKISIGRTEVRTLVALATLAECGLDELIIRGERFEMVETGVKVLDLFAPLAKGGTAGLVARPGMGQLVVLAEIFHRLKQEGYKIVLLHPEGEYPEVNDITDDVDEICWSLEDAENQVKQLGENHDVVFAADRSHVLTGGMVQLQESWSALSSVTTFLLDLKGESVDEDLPYGPLETLWQFDIDLSSRHLYPAVHPLFSTSTVLEGANLDQTHFSIQQRAQRLLRRYRELRSVVNASSITALSSADTETFNRGERLEAYLSQPFFTAEAFTGQKGEYVPFRTTLEDVRKILDGLADNKGVKELTYRGSLS
ncbi:hypothetical protein Q7A53_14665 [Halobacillus rhizosphaerae]|uniref:hypothetical protein n=1 Tax=Halobacillus rhizosphaerae TaxID=3064889 RepID=UPI00398B2057